MEMERTCLEMDLKMRALQELAEQLELEKLELAESRAAVEQHAHALLGKNAQLEDAAALLRTENEDLTAQACVSSLLPRSPACLHANSASRSSRR